VGRNRIKLTGSISNGTGWFLAGYWLVVDEFLDGFLVGCWLIVGWLVGWLVSGWCCVWLAFGWLLVGYVIGSRLLFG